MIKLQIKTVSTFYRGHRKPELDIKVCEAEYKPGKLEHHLESFKKRNRQYKHIYIRWVKFYLAREVCLTQ